MKKTNEHVSIIKTDKKMAGNKIKAKYIPINERGWLIGYAELMGYLGVKTTEKLKRDYIDQGLYPLETEDGVRRWRCSTVDKWINDHNHFQPIEQIVGRHRKKAVCQ